MRSAHRQVRSDADLTSCSGRAEQGARELTEWHVITHRLARSAEWAAKLACTQPLSCSHAPRLASIVREQALMREHATFAALSCSHRFRGWIYYLRVRVHARLRSVAAGACENTGFAGALRFFWSLPRLAWSWIRLEHFRTQFRKSLATRVRMKLATLKFTAVLSLSLHSVLLFSFYWMFFAESAGCDTQHNFVR